MGETPFSAGTAESTRSTDARSERCCSSFTTAAEASGVSSGVDDVTSTLIGDVDPVPNSDCIRSKPCRIGEDVGTIPASGVNVVRSFAGSATPTMRTRAAPRKTSGYFITRSAMTSQRTPRRGAPGTLGRRPRHGIRPALIRWPRIRSRTGSSSTEVMIENATTMTAPSAIEVMTPSGTRNSVLIAAMMVIPEKITVSPLVLRVTASASSTVRPLASSSLNREMRNSE